ncbi:MAG: MFS transporter [Pirellulales bacterium]|nr:MFS transporter [Pirellulales bacterium]
MPPVAASSASAAIELQRPPRPMLYPGAELAAPPPEAPDLLPPRRVGARFFYGWAMVPLATAIMICSAPGQTYGFMFFNPFLRQSLGLSQTQLSATYLLATLLAAAPLSYLGGLSDRCGLKRSLLAAIAAMAGSCVLASLAQNGATLLVACLGLRMIGAGVMSLLATNTLAVWFDRRLPAAAGIMQFGMALSMAVVPMSLLGLINLVGWRQAYVAIAVILTGGLWPLVAWLYRDHPREVGQQVDGYPPEVAQRLPRPGQADLGRRGWRLVSEDEGPSLNLAEALRTSVFWLLLGATAVWSLIGTGLMFHLESLLAACHLGRSQAAWATPLMAIAMASMQLGSGPLADRFHVKQLIAGALSCVMLACVILCSGSGPAALAAYVVYGAGQGLMTIVSSASWAHYFGPAHLGRIRGTAMTVGIASSAVGPLIMGASADLLGGFQASLWFFATTALAVAAAGWRVE